MRRPLPSIAGSRLQPSALVMRVTVKVAAAKVVATHRTATESERADIIRMRVMIVAVLGSATPFVVGAGDAERLTVGPRRIDRTAECLLGGRTLPTRRL